MVMVDMAVENIAATADTADRVDVVDVNRAMVYISRTISSV